MQLTSEHSFPDAQITSWNQIGDELAIEVSGVYFNNRVEGKAKIYFTDIQRISAMRYDADQEQWCEIQEIEPLKDICELHVKMNKHYSLKGFGAKSGQWLVIGIVATSGIIEW